MAALMAGVGAACGTSGADEIAIGEWWPDDAGEPIDGNAPADAGLFVPTLASCGTTRICLPNTDGWSPALVTGASSSCPSDWPSSTALQTASAGSCGCDCVANGGTCDGTLLAGSGTNCKQSTSNSWAASPGDGSCFSASLVTMVPSPFSLKPDPSAANRPTACSGTVVPSFAPPTNVVTCAGATSTNDAACGRGEACLPTFDTPKGHANCIRHDGDVACPKELSTRIVVAASVTEGRGCEGACTCAANACLGGKLELYNGADCVPANLLRTFITDGTCDTTSPAIGPIIGVMSGRYFASSGCAVVEKPKVTGSPKLAAPTTFCCLSGASFE